MVYRFAPRVVLDFFFSHAAMQFYNLACRATAADNYVRGFQQKWRSRKPTFHLINHQHSQTFTPSHSSPAMSKETASPLAHFPSESVPGYHTFLPLQPSPIGSLLPAEKFPQNAEAPKLFQGLEIRGMKVPNRCWVAPMCQCTYIFSFLLFLLW